MGSAFQLLTLFKHQQVLLAIETGLYRIMKRILVSSMHLDLLPQIADYAKTDSAVPDFNRMKKGLWLVMIGTVKKLLIADQLMLVLGPTLSSPVSQISERTISTRSERPSSSMRRLPLSAIRFTDSTPIIRSTPW